MASIRFDASRSSLPNAWVKAPARSFQPCVQDGRPDLVAGGGPVRHPVFGAEVAGQGDRPVQRHPAHQLRVQEVAGSPRISQMPWSFSRQLAAAVSAAVARNRWVTGSSSPSWSISRWAAPSSSP